MQAETLQDSEWDVVVSGTGLYQSLLVLALSRADKKVLHVDRNGYYGGSEAAFSLQEVEEWVKDDQQRALHEPSIEQLTAAENGPKLSFSRAYSIALAPQLIYADSKLVQNLVASKAYRQLEFQAMGSFWVYERSDDSITPGKLSRVPTSREDVAFAGSGIDIRSKRAAMKVLRFVMEYESQDEVWREHADKPLGNFLTHQFKLSGLLLDLFSALAMSPLAPADTSTSYALPRIARHLRSIGRLGPGFSAVVPKWGGLSEVAQVGCRAGAVGGAVYVLGNAISATVQAENACTVKLGSGDTVRATAVVASPLDIGSTPSRDTKSRSNETSRLVAIVSPGLKGLFPCTIEGAPTPAGAVVVFPSHSLPNSGDAPHIPPAHLIIHSSDTGECPRDQWLMHSAPRGLPGIIYASTQQPAATGHPLLASAISSLLASIPSLSLETSPAPPQAPSILWQLRYVTHEPVVPNASSTSESSSSSIHLLPPSLGGDPVFDDAVLARVESVWRDITRSDGDVGEFLVFEDREGQMEEDEEEGL